MAGHRFAYVPGLQGEVVGEAFRGSKNSRQDEGSPWVVVAEAVVNPQESRRPGAKLPGVIEQMMLEVQCWEEDRKSVV